MNNFIYSFKGESEVNLKGIDSRELQKLIKNIRSNCFRLDKYDGSDQEWQ